MTTTTDPRPWLNARTGVRQSFGSVKHGLTYAPRKGKWAASERPMTLADLIAAAAK